MRLTATLAPGGKTTVNVNVKDNNGRAVANSEVALVVVDESVLALTRYSIGDPADVFYAARQAGVTDHHSRKDVLLGNPDDLEIAAASTCFSGYGRCGLAKQY